MDCNNGYGVGYYAAVVKQEGPVRVEINILRLKQQSLGSINQHIRRLL